MNGSLIFADLQQFVGTMFLVAAALLPMVNPLGGAPIYLAKTVDLTPEQHAVLAKRVAGVLAVAVIVYLCYR
jgi:multiple antibiotic resistance protein